MTIEETLGVQLVSFTCFDDDRRSVAEIARLGFRHVETVGHHLEDAEGLRTVLDDHGVTARSVHVGLADARERLDWVIERSLALGAVEVYMPSVPVAERRSDADYWARLGAELGEMSGRFARAGIRFGYHNHDWEFSRFADGSFPLDHVMRGSQGSDLSWQADFAWIRRGGQDPLAWMRTYRDRLRSVHLKDELAPPFDPEERGWCALGKGILDMREAIPAIAAIQPDVSWFLEHERAKDPVGFCRDSREFVQTHFGREHAA